MVSVTETSDFLRKHKIMFGLSFGHLLVLAFVFLLLFGTKRLPHMMGDLAKGLKAFKDHMRDDRDDSEIK